MAPTDPEPRRRPAAHRFDADYYRRFYHDPATRVGDLAGVQKLAALVAAWMRYLELPVRRVLDVGCGVGHWRTALRTHFPKARYHGVEYSEHLCQQFGWVRGSIVDFDPTAAIGDDHFDLVVCQGVLQYLDDRAAARAITNLGRWTGGALYLEALTALDWRRNCDKKRTDGAVHLRDGQWYRQRLARHFHDAGGGVFPSRRAGITLFELEGR